MKQNKTTLLLAALAFLAISCAKEAVNEEPAPEAPKASTIHVTVGAGIAQTKSAVDYTNGIRTLKFTEGDQLYVRGEAGEWVPGDEYGTAYYPYILAGFLIIDPTSISDDGTSATFTGDLHLYEAQQNVNTETYPVWTGSHPELIGLDDDGNEIWEDVDEYEDREVITGSYYTYFDESHMDIADFFDSSDPLSECYYPSAQLVHNNSYDAFDINPAEWTGCYKGRFAHDLTALMTTKLLVSGGYDINSKAFDLSTGNDIQPILNCTISGLKAGVTYIVGYGADTTLQSQGYHMFDNEEEAVTANDSGTVSFAFIGNSGMLYHRLKFEEKTDNSQKDVKYVDLGQKSLVQKVYNITRTASTSIPE